MSNSIAFFLFLFGYMDNLLFIICVQDFVRTPIVLMVIVLALLLSGCNKTYFFSFFTEQDLENLEGAWYPEGDGAVADYAFLGDGVRIQNGSIACPLRFSGNFTMTVDFWLNADETHDYWFDICLGDGTFWGTTESDVHMEVIDCGSVNEYYWIADHDSSEVEEVHYDIDSSLPGLNRSGMNTWVLTKTGKNIKISVNDIQFADFDLVYYDSIWFGPNLVAEYSAIRDTNYGVTYESIKVEYSGSTDKVR
jgi:hypothetical protein